MRTPRADSSSLLRAAATIASIILVATGSWTAAIAAGLMTVALLLWTHRAAVSVVVVVGAAFVLRTVVAFVTRQDGPTRGREARTRSEG
ncbi:hypothetical protein [Microbacterium sp. lyk4-40-TSB-66]|uniref:hypothetical protein n=1 Tax=Microbacterium sp. lyk4-40-TSB-66 TaxID=3040294 RepID=UPI00254C7921|nr:hypothetical protein [Microbacterium sp. lyk4-40-TSB-66]